MTDTSTPEAAVVAQLAGAATQPHPIVRGELYAVRNDEGYLITVDTEEYAQRPHRKRGTVTASDAAAFAAYVKKHGLAQTEVWSNPPTASLVAVINAHMGTTGDGVEDYAGWGDHRVQLRLTTTPAWTAWASHDRKLLGQVDFAEHVEDRLIDFVTPDGATMLELAQTFNAKRSVKFESSRRLKSGETQLVYKEDETAAAGRKGDIDIPDTFELALRPYEGCAPYRVPARLRYRIVDGQLRLGYVLERPDEIQRAAFDDIVNAVHAEIDQPIWNGTP